MPDHPRPIADLTYMFNFLLKGNQIPNLMITAKVKDFVFGIKHSREIQNRSPYPNL